MLKALLGAIVFAAASTAIPSAHAADVTIRFPIEYSLEITPGQADSEFKRLVEERSNGRIQVDLYPSGSLYKGLNLLQAILRGDAQMTTLIQTYWGALSPKTAIFELPYAFPTKKAFYAAIDDGFFQDAYEEVEQKGAKLIGVLPFDYMVPGTRSTPLIAPTDFSGLKFRGLGKANLSMLKLLGAEPVSLNFVEVSPAIEQGLIDGLNVPTDNYMIYKWDHSIRNVTYANYYICFYPWMVNKAWWEGLDPELREIIQTAVTEVTKKYRPIAEAGSDKAIADMRAAGVNVHIQTPEERKVWMDATQPVWDQFKDQVGQDLIDRIKTYSE
jgi:C4-dicarboxylate-binding protein DctP